MNLLAKIQLDDGATMPTRATGGSVGYDVRAISATLINLNGWAQTYVEGFDLNRFIYGEGFNGSHVRIRPDFKRIILDTGIRVTPPDGYYFELVPNSRLAKTGLVYGNSFGVIDPDYTGTIKCVITVTSAATKEDIAKVMPPQVIGQLILRKKYDVDFTQVDALDETERGEGGFGSTEKEKGTCTYWCPGSMLGSKPECLKTGASECIASTCPHYQKWDKDQIFPKSGK